MDDISNQPTGQAREDSAPYGAAPGTLNVPAQRAPAPVDADDLRQRLSGANWFFWIAALSMINSIISLANGHWTFLAGLGITQVIDALAHSLPDRFGSGPTIVAGLLDVAAAGLLVAFGV